MMAPSTMDVFFFEAFEEEQNALQYDAADTLQAGYTWKTIQEFGAAYPPAQLISIRTQSVIPPEWPGLVRGILSRSTGYDHLRSCSPACTAASTSLGYLPHYCARTVAEQAMLLWMALLRRLPRQISQFDSFHRDGLTGSECKGKSLLVVGVGTIGREVALIGAALEMRVMGVDIVRRFPDIHYVALDDGLAQADIIVCCMNLTEANRGYFNRHMIRGARKKPFFINIARGELSRATDVLAMLNEDSISGVALDVFDNESYLADCLRNGRDHLDSESRAVAELRRRDNVILTPHNAFNTAEAVARKAAQSIQQMQRVLSGGSFTWPVPTAP